MPKGVPDSDRHFRYFILPVAFIERLLQWELSFTDVKHWKLLQVLVNVKYGHLLPFSIDALLGKGRWGSVGSAHMPTWCHLLGFRSSGCPLAESGFRRALDHPRGFNLLWPLGSGHSGVVVFQGYLIALSLQRHIK